MATELRYPKGYVFFDNNGDPLASGTVEYFEAGTTTNEPIYSDAAGSTALPNPITLNSAGRAVDGSSNLVAIYLSDAGDTDYKEVVKDSGGTTIWTDDNIPEPVDPTAGLTDTAKPRIQWSTDTDASVSLTAGNLGGGRLADTSSNTITYAPISASTAGNGNGYLIKKTDASNSVTFDPDGSETVDGASTFSWTEDDRAYWFISDGANWQIGTGRASFLSAGHISGLVISNNGTDATNDIDIATGSARDDGDTEDMVLSSAITKRLDAAWAVGTGNGGLDTGSIADTTYHVWLIKRTDTGVVDALFSTSASSPTMPANYDYKRRIGSIIRASSAIVAFSAVETAGGGVQFLRNVPGVTSVTDSETAALRTLSVPTGVKVDALISGSIFDDANARTLLTSPDQADTAASDSAATAWLVANDFGSFQMAIRTDTSARIRSRSSTSTVDLIIITMGWHDWRR